MKIEPKIEILVGSSAFFAKMDGFVPKDHDVLCIMSAFPFSTNVMHTNLDEKDYILTRDMSKGAFIADALESMEPLRLGKFLVPAFVEYIGLTIDDLLRLAPLVGKLDEKHKYEEVIFFSYLKNGRFELTPEQLAIAFEKYKQYR